MNTIKFSSRVPGLFCLVFIILFSVIPYPTAYAAGELQEQTEIKEPEKLYARAACLMDGDSGRVLYEKDGYEPMAMASTTKIMTCTVILEHADLEDVVTVSKYASTMPDVQLNIVEGEQYRLKDLLYSLMLESHNDVAVALAEHVGGSVEGFAELMNQKAAELGCTDTHFVTPNGLDDEDHYTTAVDLARIGSYAIQNEMFLEITNTPSYQFSELTKGRSFSVTNKDKFLYLYDGAIGIKTGFTGNAGYCFAGAVKKDGKTLVSTVLGSGWPPNKNYKWTDTDKLMDYGMENFTMTDIFEHDKQFEPVLVLNGQEEGVELACDDAELSLLLRKDETAEVRYQIPLSLEAPVEAGSQVGRACYYINGELYREFPIYTAGEVKAIDYGWCLKQTVARWLLSWK
ncbi:D-alanyl-D-alanine carboxypeptidase family protein [Anaerolentibacter hominis]|uniref:D-alanyl-D-alanine carboxypeptidase family protein n=1 Tax=Anaerolentibacter hominis TaxID=3079009 RepID=UPI0031B885BD